MKAGRAKIGLFLGPALIYLVVFTIYPTIYTWYISFRDYSFDTNTFNGLANYKSLILDSVFRTSMYNTFLYVVMAVALEFLFGLVIATLFNRKLFGKSFFLILLLLPMIIPPVVSALTFLIMYDPTLGLINHVLRAFQIHGPAWLSSPHWAKLAVVLVDVWQWTPFMALVTLTGMQYVPVSVLEAAKIDGANARQTFFFVVLPLLKRIILIALIFRSMDAFKAFESIFITTRGGPGYSTETMSIFTYLQSFNYLKYGLAAAASIIMLIVISVFVSLLGRFLKSE